MNKKILTIALTILITSLIFSGCSNQEKEKIQVETDNTDQQKTVDETQTISEEQIIDDQVVQDDVEIGELI